MERAAVSKGLEEEEEEEEEVVEVEDLRSKDALIGARGVS
jgi:hypothetical protein